MLGGITGAVLLLVLPASAFKAIVPVFIGGALVLTVLQPRISRWLVRRRIQLDHPRNVLVPIGVYLTGVYGGYFGAAQGILLLAILGLALAQDLQRTNALKNVLAGLVNGVAGLYFIFAAHVSAGAGGDHRRRINRRRAAWRPLRAQAATGRTARRYRGGGDLRDRATSDLLSRRHLASVIS